MTPAEKTNYAYKLRRIKRNKKFGDQAPGRRRERWKRVSKENAGIYFCFGLFSAVVSINATTGGLIPGIMAAGMFWLSAEELKLSKRGWKLRYDIPKRAFDNPNPECIERTMRESSNPNRQKYAFEND